MFQLHSYLCLYLCGAFVFFTAHGFAVGAPLSSQGLARFSASSETPIEIEAKELEVQDAQNRALFKGDVRVTQGNALLRTQLLIVYYRTLPGKTQAKAGNHLSRGVGGTQQDLQRLEASGGVIAEGDGQMATAEEAVYDFETERLTMRGNPVVLSEGDNVVVGERLEVNTKTGRIVLTPSSSAGRVKLRIAPSNKSPSS